MKALIFALWAALAMGRLVAQEGAWQPSSGHTQMPIWPGAAPDPQPVKGPEVVEASGNTFLVAGRQVIGCEQRDAAHDDGLFTHGNEYRRGGGRLPRRWLSDPGHRSGRHGSLRLANLQRNHVCAAQVPRDGCGAISEVGAVSGIADGARRRAADDGAGAFARAGMDTSMRTRSACLDFRQAGIWWRRSAITLKSAFTSRWMLPIKKAAGRILRWRFTQGICL